MALSMKSQQPIENRVWQSYSHCSEWNYRASVSFSGQPASLPSWISAGSQKKKSCPGLKSKGLHSRRRLLSQRFECCPSLKFTILFSRHGSRTEARKRIHRNLFGDACLKPESQRMQVVGDKLLEWRFRSAPSPISPATGGHPACSP